MIRYHFVLKENYQGTASHTAAGVQLVEGIHLEPDTADTSDLLKAENTCIGLGQKYYFMPKD